ncbi:MAG: hypothetical protein DRN12_05360 [Thermoplasmata archaeon]|nr:MAG: hypothetical protein DRN12_05360 [Thermoplasmata archaeon]
MNPLVNPNIMLPFIKSYLIERNRIERMNEGQLKRYKDKLLRRMVQYAYTVPLYRRKYKEAGVHPEDIKGIEDIYKLPFISRQDLNKDFPDGIIPPSFNKNDGYIICTGGTTTKYCCNSGAQPVCIYTDALSLLKGSIITFRSNKAFGFNWRKTKFAHIGNFNPFKYDKVFEKNIISPARRFFSFKNYLSMQASNKTMEIIKKLENFKPDVIISYPAIFQDIAYLKRKGYGREIKPRILLVGGAMLDEYTRSYVEDAFGCKMYNTYASCESGAEIAFECKYRNWHIHDDFFHIEAIDEDMKPVAPGERGRIVLTKLWGRGTPIIRYTGMNDWITLGNGEKCSCGLKSPIFGRPVEGKISFNIVLPDGQIIPPSRFLFISEILLNLGTFKVKRFQIIQKKIDEIDILLVIDRDLKEDKPSFDEMAKRIKERYLKETGPEVEINVIEVEEIKEEISGKPAPILISYVNQDKCVI